MTLRLSKWLFLFLIVSLPLARPFNVTLYGLTVMYTDFIFLCAAAFWVAALVQRQTSFRTDKIYIFIGIYALAWIVSAVFSITPTKSLFKLLGEFYLFGLAIL